ncbi:MAG: hypothetical protein RIQ60_1122 [Pseudomonadota bacterium]|jgi:hypothetical protein
MKCHAFAAVFLLSTSGAFAQVGNPLVTPATLARTVCSTAVTPQPGGKPGLSWIQLQTPTASYLLPTKSRQFYALSPEQLKADSAVVGHEVTIADYEMDHIWPIEVGGHPYEPKNLRLLLAQGPSGARAKGTVVKKVHTRLCAGSITLEQAAACFKGDWTSCK